MEKIAGKYMKAKKRCSESIKLSRMLALHTVFFRCRWCGQNDHQSNRYFNGSYWEHQLWHSDNDCSYDC